MRKGSALSLLGSEALPEFLDRGRILNKHELAGEVCQGKATARWVIEHIAPEIGMRHGREYLFYENEARAWWAKYLASKRKTA